MKRYSALLVVLVAILSLLMPAAPAIAVDAVAELVKMTGKVDILRGGKLPSERAAVGSELFVGDFIRTKSKSSAEVLFRDGNRIRVEPRSRIDIASYSAEQDQRSLGLNRGKVEAIVIPGSKGTDSERPKRFEIQTPNAVAGVRGTTIVVAFQDNITAIHVKKAHSGRSVYSISRAHPGRIVNVPVGGMMWVRNQEPPTLMPPGSAPSLSLLSRALDGNTDLGELQTLVDGIASNDQAPPTVSESFPNAFGVEVGVVDMTGTQSVMTGLYNMDLTMQSHFFAASTTTAPYYWETSSLSGSWSPITAAPPFDPTGETIFIAGSGPNGTADAFFTITSWNTSTGGWSASIDSGIGTVPNGTTFDFIGSASGGGATDLTTGTITGTASGTSIDSAAGN